LDRDAHSILRLQRAIGNQGMQRLFESQSIGTGVSSLAFAGTRPNNVLPLASEASGVSGSIQTKPLVNTPGDTHEREADYVAEQIMRMPEANSATNLPSKATDGPMPATSQSPEGIQPATSVSRVPPIVHEVLNSPGQSLDPATRSFFEPRFGRDLGGVQVHTSPSASQSAAALQARAFASGNHLVFGAGQYMPAGGEGRRLLAHELAHVVQQRAAAPVIQRQPQTTVPPTGTVATVRNYVLNPRLEPDTVLKSAINTIDRYGPTVRLAQVRFEVLPESERAAPALGHDISFSGLSLWDKDVPVIKLPQEALDAIAAHQANPDQAKAFRVIRTVGHEMHHLWREKMRGRAVSNPLQPAFETYSQRQMEQVHQNWLEAVRKDPKERQRMKIPEGRTITRWEDLPATERDRIEHDVSRLDPFQGAYERSSYIVEEIYTQLEELSYLRIQQQVGSADSKKASRQALTEMASMIYFLHNLLKSVAAEDNPIVTPKRLAETEAAMLVYLRRRFPNSADRKRDSFEVMFYLSAIHHGIPPLYDSTGKLISVPPPDSRP
jgi:hypothetical protein